ASVPHLAADRGSHCDRRDAPVRGVLGGWRHRRGRAQLATRNADRRGSHRLADPRRRSRCGQAATAYAGMSADRLKDHWREQRMFLSRLIAAALIVVLLAGLVVYRLVDLQV